MTALTRAANKRLWSGKGGRKKRQEKASGKSVRKKRQEKASGKSVRKKRQEKASGKSVIVPSSGEQVQKR
ncbi:hypothetical protein I6M38_09565 [Shewanella algae]|uniref:Uncharacterized protein n=2 Tax=Shewanella algae TaxID=38313 RepID=A0A7T8EBW0_9GAMM|nr:hypothetical protein [Shewanella algae]MBO2552234.1 hypothetical protein [Shewanella algae]QQO83505.1 hypothetical protein D7032_09665 [Shewanella algae]